MPVSYELT